MGFVLVTGRCFISTKVITKVSGSTMSDSSMVDSLTKMVTLM